MIFPLKDFAKMVVLQSQELYDTRLPSRSSGHRAKPRSSDLKTRPFADDKGTGG